MIEAKGVNISLSLKNISFERHKRLEYKVRIGYNDEEVFVTILSLHSAETVEVSRYRFALSHNPSSRTEKN